MNRYRGRKKTQFIQNKFQKILCGFVVFYLLHFPLVPLVTWGLQSNLCAQFTIIHILFGGFLFLFHLFTHNWKYDFFQRILFTFFSFCLRIFFCFECGRIEFSDRCTFRHFSYNRNGEACLKNKKNCKKYFKFIFKKINGICTHIIHIVYKWFSTIIQFDAVHVQISSFFLLTVKLFYSCLLRVCETDVLF